MSVVFSDKARNYKIPFNKRRRGIPKDAPLTLVYGGYTVEILGYVFSPANIENHYPGYEPPTSKVR